jgi:hypothetical protein
MAVNATVVDLSADTTTVSSAPAILVGVYVNTVLSAHACPIESNGTALITLVASLAAGQSLQFGEGVIFPSSLVVNPDNVATGSITVFWKSNP